MTDCLERVTAVTIVPGVQVSVIGDLSPPPRLSRQLRPGRCTWPDLSPDVIYPDLTSDVNLHDVPSRRPFPALNQSKHIRQTQTDRTFSNLARSFANKELQISITDVNFSRTRGWKEKKKKFQFNGSPPPPPPGLPDTENLVAQLYIVVAPK